MIFFLRVYILALGPTRQVKKETTQHIRSLFNSFCIMKQYKFSIIGTANKYELLLAYLNSVNRRNVLYVCFKLFCLFFFSQTIHWLVWASHTRTAEYLSRCVLFFNVHFHFKLFSITDCWCSVMYRPYVRCWHILSPKQANVL